jgi:hypothetical protein
MDVNIRISFDAPRGAKRRFLLWVALPLAIGTAAVAHAALDTSWIQAGQPVSSSKLTSALVGLDGRVASLESTAYAAIDVAYVSGAPTINNQYRSPPAGDIMVVKGSTATSVVFATGTFSQKPICTVTSPAIATNGLPSVMSTTVVQVQGLDSFSLICVGPRG